MEVTAVSASASAGGVCEQAAAERQKQVAAAIGQPAEVADARKALRQNVLQEAAQELFVRAASWCGACCDGRSPSSGKLTS